MRIWWWQTTWVVLVPITTHIPSFINVAHTELWIFDFFVISQSEQICKWGIKYAHSVTTDHMGSTYAPTTHIPSLTKIGHCVLNRERRFTFWCWRDLTYIQTALQMKTKWSFQHSWQPTFLQTNKKQNKNKNKTKQNNTKRNKTKQNTKPKKTTKNKTKTKKPTHFSITHSCCYT